MSDASGASDGLAAGDFSAWLADLRDALAGARRRRAVQRLHGVLHVVTVHPDRPDETDTIAHIPKALLFPAPRMPGHYVLGYDERGHCPMLVDDVCTIYEHRPRTCRTYDCRVLAAAEVTLDDETKTAIAERVARWRFSHPTAEDEREHRAVATRPCSWAMSSPSSATERAVYAVELYEEFMEGPTPADPEACACGSARLPGAQPRCLRPTLGGSHERERGGAVHRLAHDVGVTRVARGLGRDVQEHPTH